MAADQGGWRKSTRSSSSGNGDCVEARKSHTGFQVRDSKLGQESPVLDLAEPDFLALLSTGDGDVEAG
ncbi:DUF397 domain-containing protein [Glycomyces sp. TRM65418]|nr:DUF397 domain-containing protein [Glycomyces sp. TRM65418]QZD57770.1 DUF397 domain-containing protein [Glycomyces sp. TRM65418]